MKGNIDLEKCALQKPVPREPIPTGRSMKMAKFKAIAFLSLAMLCWMYWGPSISPEQPAAPARIDWQPCDEDPTFLCGYLEVPTDYDDPSAGTSKIALSNYPATCPQSERLGIIITNYGGPGGPGRQISFGQAARIQNLTGNRHDIISFDQRGLGRSAPTVNCFGSALKYQMFKTNTVFETTFSVPKNPFSEGGRAVLVEQQKEALALEETQGALCAETLGAQALGYMSTTTTIYDMEEISRVMEGTIVGAYLGNMLPHKAGKILIDGVVPGDTWANENYDSQALLQLLLTDSEKTYQLFLSECFKAGKDYCALSNPEDKSPDDIGKRIDHFIDKLQLQPLPVTNYTRPGYLTSGGVRMTLFIALQGPEIWTRYAQILASAMNGSDVAPLMRMIYRPYMDPSPAPDHDGYIETGQGELLRLAISCGDARPYDDQKAPTAEEIVDNILITLKSYPRFGATVHIMEQHGGCHFWPGTGVGPVRFRKTLATPTLIVANTHDPITPYAAAKIVKDTMGDSARLLLQGTVGHSYLAPATDCASKIISGYFAEGIIPDEPEIHCKREVENFFISNTEFTANPKLGIMGRDLGF